MSYNLYAFTVCYINKIFTANSNMMLAFYKIFLKAVISTDLTFSIYSVVNDFSFIRLDDLLYMLNSKSMILQYNIYLMHWILQLFTHVVLNCIKFLLQITYIPSINWTVNKCYKFSFHLQSREERNKSKQFSSMRVPNKVIVYQETFCWCIICTQTGVRIYIIYDLHLSNTLCSVHSVNLA